MKNIHILSTDKPSRLCINGKNGQHIYITNNEEIKEEDWYYLPKENKVAKCPKTIKLSGVTPEWTQKIILTTDQDLIADGVQAIDDEFLEWFIKNLSCEEVEIEKFHGINTSIAEVSSISGNDDYNWQGKGDFRDYKIIIPKEEPKQETLEEAGKNTTKKYINEREKQTAYLEFIEGDKWMQERMYSEEDVIAFYKWAYFKNRFEESDKTTKELLSEWFKQFKKK